MSKRKAEEDIGTEPKKIKKEESPAEVSEGDNTLVEKKVNPARVKTIGGNKNRSVDGPVLYWMSREMRVRDNFSLLHGQQLAASNSASPQPFAVCFNMVPSYLGATRRQYAFMMKGLQEVEQNLKKLNIPFFLLIGEPEETVSKLAIDLKASYVITDFAPLRLPRLWKDKLVAKLKTAGTTVQVVDGHNVVPLWEASEKQETAARTIRPKISRLLPKFFTEFPAVQEQKLFTGWCADQLMKENDWKAAQEIVDKQENVPEVTWRKPGEAAALEAVQNFCGRLKTYGTSRNDPSAEALSDLSPYFHFGQVAPQRACLEVRKYRHKHKESVESFLEECIIRRELADNFCYYNEKYDQFGGFAAWAQDTLTVHASDKRPFLYTQEKLEKAQTADRLWNACQLEMVHKGKMHGYMRMYWAKKILEWTESPQEALRIAIYLNDKYELDGRDPNGYVGCAWAIGGIHDQGWGERPIFGKIRYMNEAGCRRKFDVERYIAKCQKLVK